MPADDAAPPAWMIPCGPRGGAHPLNEWKPCAEAADDEVFVVGA
jgi:hypothetical protein